MRLNQLAALLLVASLLSSGACGASSEAVTAETSIPTREAEVLEIRGLVVEVQASSLTKLESLAIRDEAGNLWSFSIEGFVGLTPSHLREHQVLAQQVTVRYWETPDGLAAVSVSD